MIELRIIAREMKYIEFTQYITDLFISLENEIFWKVQSQARIREKNYSGNSTEGRGMLCSTWIIMNTMNEYRMSTE